MAATYRTAHVVAITHARDQGMSLDGARYYTHPSQAPAPIPRPMSTSLVIYVDVDNTLVRRGPQGEEIPQLHVVAHVRNLRQEGAMLYCWSAAGQQHALCAARRLGIEDCFQGFLHKPQVFLDDEETRDWSHFVHIHPENLGSYADYQSAVALKKEG